MVSTKCSKPTSVETIALERSGQDLIYTPTEKLGLIIVDHFPALGRLAALRFLEWAQAHPGGVISLPTGKTPEHFIYFVKRFLNGWNDPDIREELETGGIDPAKRPIMDSLHFVQIDEFYPIDPAFHNSFHYYVNRYYIREFGLDPKKALLIDSTKIGIPIDKSLMEIWPEGDVDLSLRVRIPQSHLETMQKDVLEAVDQWCFEYDERIRALGGIGFFLGGVGPDGHIAFNVAGSDHHSTTRLTPINYETQAASASDLGGIEVARKRHSITIGLATITANSECTALIMAAGEAKASVVQRAVEENPHIRYPATALHSLPNARFYITKGAAKKLKERTLLRLNKEEEWSDSLIDEVIINLAVTHRKPIIRLSKEDFKADPFGHILVKKQSKKLDALVKEVDARMKNKLAAGTVARSKTRFLHTAPHHDDIMLGYFPYLVRHIRDASNQHTFAYMTSGFNAVTNGYALSLVEKCRSFLHLPEFKKLQSEDYFRPTDDHSRNRDVWQYLDGVAGQDTDMKNEGEARRMLRNLMEIYEEEDSRNLQNRIDELSNYLRTQYAGKKDIPFIQQFKGMIREWEADCLWGYLGFDSSSVEHMRLGFYKGDLFTEEPTHARDVKPIIQLLKKTEPEVVSVALDPEASGPDTHYKVLQAIAEALRTYEKSSGRSDIEVWGYRNVWFRFHPAEADIYVPVSLNMLSVIQSVFVNAFVSQKDASFPSYDYDGPFSGLSQAIQVQQYQTLKTCLNRRFFNEHERPLIRGARGFVFLRRMTLSEFFSHAREIRKTTEDIS